MSKEIIEYTAYECPYCNEVATNINDIFKYEGTEHKRIYTCKICGKEVWK